MHENQVRANLYPDSPIVDGVLAGDVPIGVAAPVEGWHRVVFVVEANGTPVTRWSVDVWCHTASQAMDAVQYSETTVNANAIQIVGVVRLDSRR